MVLGQSTREAGVRPARSSARAETTLNVDPGWTCPNVATGWSFVASLFAAASTAPVEGRTATSDAPLELLASVFSASFCRPTLSVVPRGSPATALTSNAVVSGDEEDDGSAEGEGDEEAPGDGLAEADAPATSFTTTPGVPRSW